MEEDLLEKVQAYAARYGLEVRERLGSGVHGIVNVVESKEKPGKTALKVHRDADAYFRERHVYQQLREAQTSQVLEFHVPELIRFDDELTAIEMSIVAPPFVLDFAGAYLQPMDFSEEIWSEWESSKREQFGEQWTKVLLLLKELKQINIFLLDPSPSNIRFE
jgi:hypothetical protein